MNSLIFRLAGVLALTFLASPGLAQDTAKPSPAATSSSPAVAPPAVGQPSEADMMQMMGQMMELAKTGENHKLLGQLAGDWTYTVKMWMNPDPKTPPSESKGTSTRKAIMDGRFYVSDTAGSFMMPGPDGKMKPMNFVGMAIEGYDNVKKKFTSAWIDNMGTGIMISEGDYDAATKTFTYRADFEMVPGVMTKIREVIKVVDKDHHTFEWYENRGGQEVKTMEISYTRKK